MKQHVWETRDVIPWMSGCLGFALTGPGEQENMTCSSSSALSRSKDEAEPESGSPACGGDAERRPPGYSAELEARCEELRATLDGLVRPADPAPAHAAPDSRAPLAQGLAWHWAALDSGRSFLPGHWPLPPLPGPQVLMSPRRCPRPSFFWSQVLSGAPQ